MPSSGRWLVFVRGGFRRPEGFVSPVGRGLAPAAPEGFVSPVGRGLLDAPPRWFSAGGFRRLRAASFFLDAQKEAKEAPRGELRMSASRSYSLIPWTPHLRGTLLKGIAAFPARKTRSACLRLNPAPLGAWVRKI